MKKIWIRPALKSDAPLYAEYAAANSARSLFDMNVLTYPNTSVYVAHSGDPVMFLPVQMAAVLESLAPKPGLPRSEQARALAEIVTSVVYDASRQGVREIYFLSADAPTIEFAKRHGFEEVRHTVLRLKLGAIEEPHAAH